MDLVLMRHGPAAASRGLDADRTLTTEGRSVVETIASRWRESWPPPSRIVASPYARARETAEIVGHQLAPQVSIDVDDDLVPDGDPCRLVMRLAAREEGGVLLVGHQPSISEALTRLLRGGAAAFSPATAVRLERRPAGWRAIGRLAP